MSTPEKCDITPRLTYLAYHADAAKRREAGQKQLRCAHCRRWYWPGDAKRHKNGGEK